MDEKLTREQWRVLLQLARKTLEERLLGGEKVEQPGNPEFLHKQAVFVTLTMGGKLRGCIGNLIAVAPLWQSVRDNAISAAFHDHRFDSLTVRELEKVNIELSLLSHPQPLSHKGGSDLLSKLRPGVDGVILKKEGRSATFLPQVWEQLKEPVHFLDHLCVKAGLPQKSWMSEDVSVETYQVACFSEEEL